MFRIDCSVWKTPTGGLKIFELALDIICVAILRLSTTTDDGLWIIEKHVDDVYLAIGTYVAFLIINMVLLITFLTGGVEISTKTILEILFCFLGAVLHIASGALFVDRWEHLNSDIDTDEKMMSIGCLSIINGIFFAGDTVFAVVKYTRIRP